MICSAAVQRVFLSGIPEDVCFGRVYQLNCTHPVLSTTYLPGVLWKKNSVEHIPDGITESSHTINSTYTSLRVNIRKGLFVPGTCYSCFIVRIEDNWQESSNSIHINPLGM